MSGFTHVDDYPAIPVSFASTRTALKTGAWRSVRPVFMDRTAPCSAACPAGVTIPAYLEDIAAGRLDVAFATMALNNPFPRITGRVCPHFCESACNLAARTKEEPVSIRAIERRLGDATADIPHQVPLELTGRRVAVVGAGPAGLSAAYYLRRSGHDVTVFDRRDRPGGLLRYGIPNYRLPSEIVDEEVARLDAMGIEFRSGVSLGSDVTLDDLAATFTAVFVATGACRERGVDVPGESLTERGLDFLESVTRGDVTMPGRRCAVIGGGNTAMDVARMLHKLGGDVTVLYRRTEAEMPAIREEYERATAEGVAFMFLAQPRSVAKDGGDLVVTVEQMRLGEMDASGRPRPLPTGQTKELRFDGVFAATGETADMTPFPTRMAGDDGWLALTSEGATRERHVYAGGDLATGPATVIAAIAAGRRAARAIDQALDLGHLWPADGPQAMVPAADINPAYAAPSGRAGEQEAFDVSPLAEESLTMGEAEMLAEIARCLSCGHCNACGTCFVFCPDGAITWGDGPVIDYEFCKGCGICVAECPGHSLILINEREASHA